MNDIGSNPASRFTEPPTTPPAGAVPGPFMQSVAIGFRIVYVVTLLLGVAWLFSNIRQIDPDSQAVVMRFGQIVRTQKAGLLLAWPRPIEQVELLPGADRQLSQPVAALPQVKGIRTAAAGTSGTTETLPARATPYITGDNNIVLLDATLIYHVTDPRQYFLSQTHVAPALNRLFRATAVRVTAKWRLNDFLVAQPNAAGGGGQTVTALRDAVRQDLLNTMNGKLQALDAAGAGLGVTIDRIDMTALLPPEAKVAFDAVLTATQNANQNIAAARTDAERLRQGAQREGDRVTSAASATATERVVDANVNTSNIDALEKAETRQSRNGLLQQAYRDEAGTILNKVGTITVVDPKSGAHYIMPGNQR